MTKIIYKEVTKCSDCLYFHNEGIYSNCKLAKRYIETKDFGLVFDFIPDFCPLPDTKTFEAENY